MNTPTEPEYSHEDIMVILRRIEERIKKIEKKTCEERDRASLKSQEADRQADNRYVFTQDNIDKSPTDGGIYALYDGNITIYIGKGDGVDGIRARLQAHKRGDEGNCTKRATHYYVEVCSNPQSRARAELQAYRQAYDGRRPRCNNIIP